MVLLMCSLCAARKRGNLTERIIRAGAKGECITRKCYLLRAREQRRDIRKSTHAVGGRQHNKYIETSFLWGVSLSRARARFFFL